MTPLLSLGIWVICGCIMSVIVYMADEHKHDRKDIYSTNLYIFFMVLFWPIAVYFFFRFLIAALSKTPGGGND